MDNDQYIRRKKPVFLIGESRIVWTKRIVNDETKSSKVVPQWVPPIPGHRAKPNFTKPGVSLLSLFWDPCALAEPMVWTSGSTSLAQSQESGIVITGGVGPYSWAIVDETGSGFSLEDSETDGGNNTWYTSAAACGSAAIQITDACGEVLFQDIKCTAGSWTTVSPEERVCWCTNPYQPPVNCCDYCSSPTSNFGGNATYCYSGSRERWQAYAWKGYIKCCNELPGQECVWGCTGICAAWDALANSICGNQKLLGGMILQKWTC